jgi:hypothetical protein
MNNDTEQNTTKDLQTESLGAVSSDIVTTELSVDIAEVLPSTDVHVQVEDIKE